LRTKDSYGPLALHSGDFDMNGFPDLLVVATDGRTVLLQNIPCLSTTCSAEAKAAARRTFKPLREHVDVLADIHDAETALFLPFSPASRFPDIVVQTRSGPVAVRNAFYRDAFFLQVEVMNGVCPRTCKRCKECAGRVLRPYGGGYPGASVCYDLSDPDGNAQIRVGVQVPQSSYLAVPLPFMIFGLGRVSNFVEQLEVAVPARHLLDNDSRSARRSHIIPNARLVALPPHPDDPAWKLELYINPAEYLLWVGVAATVVCIVFAGLTGIFKAREYIEDREERRRTLRAFNFGSI
jgi:integrin alpha FG-GAP repeat containing protein 1